MTPSNSTPSADDLFTAFQVIRSLYKKNTSETVAVLRRIEEALSEKGYMRVGDVFYRKRDVERLTPLHQEPKAS